MIPQSINESLSGCQSLHCIVILAIIGEIIARQVVLNLTVSTSEANCIIHCQATLAPIVAICEFFFLIDWLGLSHELIIILVLGRQVEKCICTLHVSYVIILGRHHNEFFLLDEHLDKSLRDDSDKISSIIDNWKSTVLRLVGAIQFLHGADNFQEVHWFRHDLFSP
jgi:hypothetical protein